MGSPDERNVPEPSRDPDHRHYVANNVQILPSLGWTLAAGATATATIDLIPPGPTLNASPVLSNNTRYGQQWLNVVQILGGRLIKVGTQIDFWRAAGGGQPTHTDESTRDKS